MSESIRRRSSSRQLLQNLIRVTAQRSQEDAEEVERERRRRARERQREEDSPSRPEPAQHHDLTHDRESDEDMKPSSFLVLDEDEGFSDWSHRLENRHEQEVPDRCRAREQRRSEPQWNPEPEDKKPQQDEQGGREPERRSQNQEPSQRPAVKASGTTQEVRMSYSSSVFLPQDNRLHLCSGQAADRTSYLVAGTMKSPGGGACRVDAEMEQEEQREEKEVVQQDEEDEEDEGDPVKEQVSFTHEKKEDVHPKRDRQMEEEEEEHKMVDKATTPVTAAPVFVRSADSRGPRTEEGNTSAAPLCSSSSSSEGEEPLNCYGPMSPTFKKLLIQFYPDEVNSRVSTEKCTIAERTECLRRSSSMKKTPPPVAVSKINKKLEQYTHALEVSSKEGRSGCQLPTDLTSPPEPVAFKKNLFEAREVWTQNPISVTSSKDADGLKVGVADLINQWVRGSEDGSRCSSPSKPAESSAGKKYKFVVTGHGKYEKVSVEDDDCQTAGLFCENL